MSLNSAYWTHVYNRLDEAYAKGRGFAIKPADSYTEGAKDNFIVRLPKDDRSYAYYDSESQKDMTVNISRTDENYRMLADYGDKSLELTQPLEQNVHKGNGYHLVGNPFTATISMYRFLEKNTAFENSVWTLVNGEMTSHSVPTDKAYDRKTDVMIAPMQAFFVKVKDGVAAPDNVAFTAAMLVNRNITAGEKQVVERPALTLTAANTSQRSKAVVVEDSMSSRDFSDGEDVELLSAGEIADVPQVYTVAGTQAVALNTTSNFDWMPMGIVAKKSGMTDIEININRQMQRLMESEGTGLFLFDAKTQLFTPVADGTRLQLAANDHGRYYITRHDSFTSTGISPVIDCFSPTAGTIVVAAMKGNLARAAVYDISGKLVASRTKTETERCQIGDLNGGIYVVKATATDGTEATFKIAVR